MYLNAHAPSGYAPLCVAASSASWGGSKVLLLSSPMLDGGDNYFVRLYNPTGSAITIQSITLTWYWVRL